MIVVRISPLWPVWRRMVRDCSVLVLIALLFGAEVSGQPSSSASAPDNHTRVDLVADVREVIPGVPFTLGVRLRMDAGWHTYWENPGESGIPTDVEWSLPPGFRIGPLQWPIPEKKVEAGEILSYGYSTETVLMATVEPPKSLRSGSRISIAAGVSWLECERVCIPGDARVSLELPVGTGPAREANSDLFSTYRRLLPKPLAEFPNIRVSSSFTAGELTILIQPSDDSVLFLKGDSGPDFYPSAYDDAVVGRTTMEPRGNGAVLTVRMTPSTANVAPKNIGGVIIVSDTAGYRRGISVEFPLGGAFADSSTSQGGGTGLLNQTFVTGQLSADETPIVLYLLFAVLGGLLLNIMPCVLPVIALKIFGLVRMAGDEPGRVRRLGWSFSLGILASFLVLAGLVIVLQIAGQQVGWGFQFQEPLFVIAMSAVVFAFGLSLFGVFEIRLPGAAVSGVTTVLTKQEGNGKGYTASFSEGVFATILATPCTAPFLGSALGFAFSQPPGIILLIFASVALGMALPYLLLTARPAWLTYMPKPGEWMVTAKQFMGFLMMATLLWLLYVLGKQLGMEAVIGTGAFLLMVGIACWLLGRFADLSASRRAVFTTWVFAAGAVGLGYWLFISPLLAAGSVLEESAVSSSAAPSGEGIEWQRFSVAMLEDHLSAGRPVFLDFTADWCLTCKVNEKTVLADADVIGAFRSSGIVPVKADWTKRNADITRLLAQFGRSGVPLYVLFPAGNASHPLILPEVITVGIVLDAIEKAVSGRVPAQGQ